MFQSTLPRGERHKMARTNTRTTEFQSTLPRGERHLQEAKKEKEYIVSIHAPAWGAT